MADIFHIETHWGNRQETARECAVRLARMLEALATINSSFARWNKKAMTRAKADVPFCMMPPRIDELTTIFERHLSHKDVPPEQPWPELGFFVYAWNGRDDSHGLSFRLRAGAYDSHLPYPNEVVLRIPSHDQANSDLVNPATMREILARMIDAWEPLWGGIFSFTYGGLRMPPQPEMTRQERGRQPVPPPKLFWNPGWVAYLSNDYAPLFAAPPEARVKKLRNHGIVVSTTDELFSSENPKHLAAADDLGAALKQLETDLRARQ